MVRRKIKFKVLLTKCVALGTPTLFMDVILDRLNF